MESRVESPSLDDISISESSTVTSSFTQDERLVAVFNSIIACPTDRRSCPLTLASMRYRLADKAAVDDQDLSICRFDNRVSVASIIASWRVESDVVAIHVGGPLASLSGNRVHHAPHYE